MGLGTPHVVPLELAPLPLGLSFILLWELMITTGGNREKTKIIRYMWEDLQKRVGIGLFQYGA